MPELSELINHESPIVQRQRVNILSLHDAIEFVCDGEKVAELQGLVVMAVEKLIDGDFHQFDAILHSVGQTVNHIANQK